MTGEQAQLLIELIKAGSVMSNVIHNCYSAEPRLEAAKRAWDEARDAARSAEKALRSLPPAFDPIYLGC